MAEFYDVIVHRTVTQEMRVGMEADTPEQAKERVLALEKVQRPAGWQIISEETPVATEAIIGSCADGMAALAAAEEAKVREFMKRRRRR